MGPERFVMGLYATLYWFRVGIGTGRGELCHADIFACCIRKSNGNILPMHQQIHVTQPLKLAANWNGARYFAKSILVLYIHTSANVCFLHPFCCSFVCSSECQLGTD